MNINSNDETTAKLPRFTDVTYLFHEASSQPGADHAVTAQPAEPACPKEEALDLDATISVRDIPVKVVEIEDLDATCRVRNVQRYAAAPQEHRAAQRPVQQTPVQQAPVQQTNEADDLDQTISIRRVRR